jgi:flagellar biosynthesis chaperone FliJ
MKRFAFQQQRLLSIKLQQQKQAEIAVSISRQSVLACEQKMEEHSKTLDRQMAMLEQGHHNTSSTMLTLDSIQGLQLQLVKMQEELKQLEAIHRKNCNSLRAINVEVETFESLKAQKYKVYKVKLEAKRQQIADELAQNRKIRQIRLAEKGKVNG